MSAVVYSSAVFGVVVVVILIVYSCYSIYVLAKEAKKRSDFRSGWTKVTGRVKDTTPAGCSQQDATASISAFPFSKWKCTTRVEFSFDGKSRTEDIETLTFSQEGFKRDDELSLYVNPENPTEVEYRDYSLIAWRITLSTLIILLVFGSLLFAGGWYIKQSLSKPVAGSESSPLPIA